MAVRDLVRAWAIRLVQALAIAGLREPGAPPPPQPQGMPMPRGWPEAPPPRRERPGPVLDGQAARRRALRDALLIPALAILVAMLLARAGSGIATGDAPAGGNRQMSVDAARDGKGVFHG